MIVFIIKNKDLIATPNNLTNIIPLYRPKESDEI